MAHDPISVMQWLWLKFLETNNVRWCHALSARAQLFEIERRDGREPVENVTVDNVANDIAVAGARYMGEWANRASMGKE